MLKQVFSITALGLRWAESLRAAATIASGSLWVGRQVGDAAGAATLTSGRLVRDGWRGLELNRRRRPSEPAPSLEDEQVDPVVKRARRRLVLERPEEPAPSPPPRVAAKAASAAAAPRKPAPVPEPLPEPLDAGFALPELDLLTPVKATIYRCPSRMM